MKTLTPAMIADSQVIPDEVIGDYEDQDESQVTVSIDASTGAKKGKKRPFSSVMKLDVDQLNVSESMQEQMFDYNGLLRRSLSECLDTFELIQIVGALRPHFLTQQILLLTCGEISLLSALQDGTYESVPRDQMTQEAFRLLTLWSSESLQNIKAIRGIMFSTTEMASKPTLKFFTPRNFTNPGHFIYFDFSLETKKVKCIDSLSDSFSNNLYFDESCLRSFFSFVLRAKNFNTETKISSSRGFLPQVSVKRTSQRQCSLECGVISAFNLILSFKFTYDILTHYKLPNYRSSAENIKNLLCHIVYSGTIPFEAIKEI